MNFLYPGFLFALFAVAIPVIIHLFNFRKFKKVYFSNVAFLKEIKEQRSSREKLKNLLVLICRILAIIFLVLAFSRPYLSSDNPDVLSGSNTVSIYIDNSYSMEAVNKDGNLLDEAKRNAKEVVRYFPLNDRFQLLTNDFEGKHQRLLNTEEMIRAIDQVKISGASRTLQQVINRQQSIFTGSGNRYSYVISDFQKGFAGSEMIYVDKHTRVYLVALKANRLPNVALDSVWLLSPVHQQDAAEKVVVRIRNYSDETAKNIPLRLSVNDVQKAVRNLTVEGGETKNDTLSFSGLRPGWQKGTVSLKDFPLTFDDQLYFSFNVGAGQQVLSINGAKNNRYIQALFTADPYFKLTEMPENNIRYTGWSAYSLIVLNGLNQLSSGLASALRSYVDGGGSVVIFPDLEVDSKLYTTFLTTLGLPGISALNTRPVRVSAIELKNPLFKDVFEHLPRQLDLPQVNRHFVYAEHSHTQKEDLLRLPGNTVFFARYPQKKGQLYLAAGGLDPADGNLAEHPVFVPLLYKIAFTAVRGQVPYYTTMKDEGIETGNLSLGANESLKIVADHFEIIPEIRQNGGTTVLYTADQVKNAGFYALKLADSLLSVLAFNDNRTESDMHYDTPSDLGKITNAAQVSLIDHGKDTISASIAAKNKGMELWKLCLILCVVFLAAEIILVRFYHINYQSNT